MAGQRATPLQGYLWLLWYSVRSPCRHSRVARNKQKEIHQSGCSCEVMGRFLVGDEDESFPFPVFFSLRKGCSSITNGTPSAPTPPCPPVLDKILFGEVAAGGTPLLIPKISFDTPPPLFR